MYSHVYVGGGELSFCAVLINDRIPVIAKVQTSGHENTDLNTKLNKGCFRIQSANFEPRIVMIRRYFKIGQTFGKSHCEV